MTSRSRPGRTSWHSICNERRVVDLCEDGDEPSVYGGTVTYVPVW
jgi:hypothetical protein